MGLPIRHFVCASNRNNILTDFLRTGTYDRNRAFHLTMSPSMDILISSNLERLLCLSAGEERTAAYMDALKNQGVYTVEADVLEKITENFSGYFADEAETAKTIKAYFEEYGYLADTHTAVALSAAEQYAATLEANERRPIVVDSTASPYKFAADVYESLGKTQPADPLAALDELSAATATEIPYPLRGLAQRTVRFESVIPADEMPKAVLDWCN
jgi:threonine synthase